MADIEVIPVGACCMVNGVRRLYIDNMKKISSTIENENFLYVLNLHAMSKCLQYHKDRFI